MDENQISYVIRGAIFEVYNELGPGLLESVYQFVLKRSLEKKGLNVRSEVPVPVYFDNEKLEIGFRIDLLVNDLVIIEIKSVEMISRVHHKQVLTYLKLSNKKLGLLVNFNEGNISKGIFRKVNNL